jgi:hypothetical protein
LNLPNLFTIKNNNGNYFSTALALPKKENSVSEIENKEEKDGKEATKVLPETPRKGRPPQTKRPVGRPKGEATVMKEYRQRMLNSPRSKKVLDSIFEAALDDDHKNQAAAWKIIVDRIVPISGFEKEAGSLQRAAIQVNISGVGAVDVNGGAEASESASEAIEGDYEVTTSKVP